MVPVLWKPTHLWYVGTTTIQYPGQPQPGTHPTADVISGFRVTRYGMACRTIASNDQSVYPPYSNFTVSDA